MCVCVCVVHTFSVECGTTSLSTTFCHGQQAAFLGRTCLWASFGRFSPLTVGNAQPLVEIQLPLETRRVAHDKTVILRPKHHHQTFAAPHSTGDHNTFGDWKNWPDFRFMTNSHGQ